MSRDMTIAEFCDEHHACRQGREWALANCSTMADVWRTADHLWLMWVANRDGVLTKRELRLFAVWCARQVQHLMTDQRSLAALDVAERHAAGLATDGELAKASRAAKEAFGVAACHDYFAALAASSAAKDPYAWAVDAAASAARAAVSHGEICAAKAAQDAQDAWLRENTKPNFTRRATT